MSDYKRRVSPIATVKASYEACLTTSAFPGGFFGSRPSPKFRRIPGSASNENRSDILGLAAGGQMYGARDLRPLIVSFIS